MKKIFILAAVFALIALALILAEAFLRRTPPGASFAGEISDPATLGEAAIFLE